MWIRHLSVIDWRGLSFELSGLAPGMNLIHGPNESGKSRLVEALRFALFESSSGRSAHKKALSTWGLGARKPRVVVEFELAGTVWKLEKEFLGTGCNTVLRSGRETLDAAEAEDRLAELVGVTPGGRVERKPEDRGIWSLLWVDQGASRDAPAHNETSQSRIHDRLTAEIGEVAAGELGQQILRRAEEQRNHYYTSNRDAEKSTLTEPRERVERLRQRVAEATTRRDAVARDADELDRLRAAERDLQERVAAAEQRQGDIRGKAEEASELGRRLELYDEQVRTCESRRDRCLEGLHAADTLAAQIRELTVRADRAAAVQAAAARARDQARQAHEAAVRAAAAADHSHEQQERQVLTLRRRRELAGLQEQAERLRQRLHDAARMNESISAIQQTLAPLPRLGGGDVEWLRNARETRDAARARLEGASASVELTAHQDLDVSGAPLPRGATRKVLVEDERHLEVAGILSITVRPGGGELAKLRDAASDAERALRRLLESHQVADLGQAERVAAQRRELEGELGRSRAELERLLPEGPDAARAQLEDLDARLSAAGEPGLAPVTAEELEQAEARLKELSALRDEHRARREVSMEALASERETAASRQSELASLQQQLDDAVARRQALPETTALRAELEVAEQAWRERVAARDEMEQRFEALGGEDIELDLEQATRACRQLDEELQQTRLRRAALQARLESAGDDGRHEHVQDLAAELLGAERELTEIERRAVSARHLYQVLLEEYENARERLTQPVISRIRPYLASLFPASEVWLDEDLNLLGLRSRDTDQPFDALSGGAREQLALLVRIGLAEVVGAEEPWPLVLDDVLVNTDAERIRLVQRLLYQASRHMQILLFTCHGPLFDALGAQTRIELPPPRRPGRGAADEAISAG